MPLAIRLLAVFTFALLSQAAPVACLGQTVFDDPDFIEELVARPDGFGWSGVVGMEFAPDGSRAFAWERGGKVWILDDANPVASPLINIGDEVLAWRDFGLLGFALDPNFAANGHIYLYFVVDRHHLEHCSEPAAGIGSPVCDSGYDPNVTIQTTRATIGRIARYTAIKPAGASNFSGATTVNYASRKVLLGETKQTGCPIMHQSHGTGSLVFGTDGTLLAACGDGASYSSTDDGSASETAYTEALADGIIKSKENIGAYRAQLVDSHNGKILRIDPATGNGIASNPYYNAAAPRSAASRVWALGLRNPYRMTLRPGSGQHDPAAASPGALYIGDVGWNTWEDLHVSNAPGQNFGWPAFEGMTQHSNYWSHSPVNQDATNALGCAVKFTDLIKQASVGTPTFANPCGGGNITTFPTHVHARPTLDWTHDSDIARYPAFDAANNPVAVTVGQPVPGTTNVNVQGTPFRGNASTGGIWYTGDNFPGDYKNTYFHGDFGGQWIKNIVLDENDNAVQVRPFISNAGGVVHISAHPTQGQLYYIQWGSYLRKVSYAPGGNRPPTAVASASTTYGPSPLTVDFTGNQSFDPESTPLSYSWDFGDGSPLSTIANPQHDYVAPGSAPASFTATLAVTDSGSPPLADVKQILISVNNTPPNVTITSPANGSLYPMTGDTIYNLTATISDAEHSAGQLSCAWQVFLHHNNHEHADPVDYNCSTQTQISPLGCGEETYYYSIRLTVTDAGGLQTTRVSSIFPNCPNNTAPIAFDDSATVTLGANVDINVAQNDVDNNSVNPDSIVITSPPSAGNVVIQPGLGIVTYTPTGSAASVDTFEYTIADFQGLVSNQATVTVTVSDTVAKPQFSPGAGTYTAPIVVSLSTTTAGATIRYTTDGSNPTSGSTVYTGSGIALSSNTTLKARAYKSGLSQSPVATAVYTFQAPAENFAPQATVTASSQYSATYAATNAVDGQTSGDPYVSNAEWASAGQKAGAWIDLSWGSVAHQVGRVVLYDRPNSNDQILSGSLSFSDGSTVPVGALDNNGAPLTVEFTPRSTTSLRFTVNTVASTSKNIGLAEIEVFGPSGNQPPVAGNDSASVFEGQSVVIPVLGNDTDDAGLDPATVTIVALPSAGSITAINPSSGAVTYTHGGGTQSSDSFTYTVRDLEGEISNTATVSLSISPYVPPTVVIVSPTNAQVVTSSTLSVQFAKSGDATAYDHVHVRLDSNPHVTIHDMSVTTHDFGVVEPGAHSITVWLVDAGHVALTNPESTKTVSFQVGVATPVMSPPGGIYTAPQNVSLSTTTAGASIYYTLNGSAPTQASAAYSGPILIDTDKTLKARAYLSGASPSGIASATYTFQAATQNVAPQATVTASSQYSATYAATNAVDGQTSGDPFVSNAEWASAGQKAGAWINLSWGATVYQVSQVVLYDRPNSNDRILSGTLTFSDGSTVAVGALDNAGAPLTVDFAPRSTTSVRFTVNTVASTSKNIGLAEIEVFGSSGPVPPTANAGPDRTIIDANGNGSEPVTLDGSASTDADGFIVNYRWSEGATVLAQGSSATATVTLAIGVHNITLQVTDNAGLTASDSVTITVQTAPANTPPSVNAGPDMSVTVGDLLHLDSATVSDDGLPAPPGSVSVLWSYVSGPAAPTWPMGDQASVHTHVQFSQVGTYTLRLTANDSALTAFDEIIVTVTGNVAMPVMTPAGGTYTAPIVVSLSTTTAGATIRYTTDGSNPTSGSTVYTGSGIALSSNTTLKARAYKSGLSQSPVATAVYTFQAPAENFAPQATVTASSQYSATYAATNAVDGQTSGDPYVSNAEWASAGQKAGAWIDLSWGSVAHQVGRVVLYDRPNSNDQILSGSLSFSDGSTVPVGALDNNGAPLTVEFTPRSTTSLRFTVNTVASTSKNIGLAEIEVFGPSGNQPPVAGNDSASVFEGQSVVIPVLGNDTDDAGLDPATVTIVALPSAGSITAINPSSGAVTYTHGGGTQSSDSFTYTVRDLEGEISNTATVSLSISPYVPPTVVIVSPTNAQVVTSSTLSVQFAKSGDATAYDHVHVRLDSNPHVTIHDMSVTTHDFGVVEPGPHSITVWLVDAGHVALTNPESTKTVSFQVGVATPVMSPPGGIYTAPQNVSLSTTTAGASIYYTLNGSAPTQASAAYSGPILIDTDKTLKARAYLSGASPSGIASATYTFQAATQNVAPQATVTASSQYSATYAATNAVDGQTSGDPFVSNAEWASAGQKAGAWINLSWGATVYQVSQVVLYDRPNSNDRILSGTLTFSDGSTVAVGALDNAGAPLTVDFAPRSTTSVRFTVNTVASTSKNIGLAEIEVFGSGP